MIEGEIFVVVLLSPWFTYPHSPLYEEVVVESQVRLKIGAVKLIREL